jgi:hypothetical protein
MKRTLRGMIRKELFYFQEKYYLYLLFISYYTNYFLLSKRGNPHHPPEGEGMKKLFRSHLALPSLPPGEEVIMLISY